MAEVDIASHDLMTKETVKTEPKQESTSHTLLVPAPMRIKASSASNRFVLEGTQTQVSNLPSSRTYPSTFRYADRIPSLLAETPPKPPPVVILDLGSYPRGHRKHPHNLGPSLILFILNIIPNHPITRCS
ncbi:hypothetical protein PGTUg99_037068 [Puccinia graminis f. sp. tritici]|uniref:Uncharacterized protein n=1 Tax=Puccinia graminis f. sp. tritici TaxID=56615 RepID=A0A5B0R985_PUCGR|nr:hypothetical protein PGTUg99_037068 [Puccinia graminis f. sp. tritici]